MSTSLPIVALVGRTNVGKSTLFNRLLETQKALVSPTAGTTRDRNEGDCLWRGTVIRLVDTGGLDVNQKDEIERNIVKQADIAMKTADLLLFVLDMKAGTIPEERALADRFRKSGKPVIVVGNKAEKASERMSVSDSMWRFPGLPEPLPISATRGTGVGDLLDAIYEKLEDIGRPPVDPLKMEGTKVAVIGKPNVGKSTLLNALIGEERFITSPIEHTTREPNDTLFQRGEKKYIFIDTAGMRKHAKVRKAGGLEHEAVKRNELVVKLADVTLLVLDATQKIGTQEKVLAGFLKHSGSAVLIVVNKWDLIHDKETGTMNQYREYIAASLPFLAWAPVHFVSALSTQRVQNLFDAIDAVNKNRSIDIDQEKLKKFLEIAVHQFAPVVGHGPWAPKVLGMKQVRHAPPTFDLIIKAKRTDTLNQSYIRYLENRLREHFKLEGTPLAIDIRLASAVSD